MYEEHNGDVFARNTMIPTYNIMSGTQLPVASPIYDSTSGGILSLKQPRPLGFGDVIRIFDVRVYCVLLLSVLLVSAFLYFSNVASRLRMQSFCRQFYETLLLMALEPRVPGLVRERQKSVRIAITVSILAGMVMRKNFYAKINAIFAFQSFDFVSDLNDSLHRNPDVKSIVTKDIGGAMVLQEIDDIRRHYEVTAYNARLTEVDRLDYFLNNKSIYFYTFVHVERIATQFPFIPAKLSRLYGLFGDTPVYFFPVSKYSPLFGRLYKWYAFNLILRSKIKKKFQIFLNLGTSLDYFLITLLFSRMHRAFDCGISDYINKRIEIREHRKLLVADTYERVRRVYYKSKYYLMTRKQKRETKIILWSVCLLLSGFLKSMAYFFREIYLDTCFG